MASLDLAGFPPFEQAFLAFVWSPTEVRFHCAPRGLDVGMLTATGTESPVAFRVASDGSVVQLGDQGVRVMGVRVQQGGQTLIAPTAIEVWQSTLQAVEVLWTGKSDQGFIFETLQATTTLSMLVTGLENYGKTRLLEVETEGITPDAEAVFTTFASKAERESSRLAELRAEAASRGKTALVVVVENARINFQNYEDLKFAFRAAYGIKLANLGVASEALAEFKRLIGYRHRVVHVSPLLALLNQDRVPPEEPVFANRELANRAVEVFHTVVHALHTATLGLCPAS